MLNAGWHELLTLYSGSDDIVRTLIIYISMMKMLPESCKKFGKIALWSDPRNPQM
jgi:hypothetical protein